MVTKNILGISILVLNAGGLAFMLYMGGQAVMDHFFPREDEPETDKGSAGQEPEILNDHIIPDEDDLLKDMDLSDLDNLNLDDFE